jgi:hypothetical protein
MPEIKNLTPEEIAELKELNQNYNKVVGSIGDVELKIQLLNKEKDKFLKEKEYLIADYDTLRTKETEITNKLLEKYGEGKIDLDSGKIELI